MAKRKVNTDHKVENNPQNPKHKEPEARSPNQKKLIQSIKKYDITICDGRSGTGKTHIAIGMGINYIRNNKDFEKLMICRPIIESGENIGYLPGTAEEKLMPYIQPCMDELEYFSSKSEIYELKNSDRLKIVPFGFMRGRTFKNCYIIVDEAQNIGFDQMKMFLTRIGEGSKVVIIGDFNQSDLQQYQRGAFQYVFKLFQKMDCVGSVTLDDMNDIQRHPIVREVEENWDKYLTEFRSNGTVGSSDYNSGHYEGPVEHKNVLYD